MIGRSEAPGERFERKKVSIGVLVSEVSLGWVLVCRV
jgi:hypothetical protein